MRTRALRAMVAFRITQVPPARRFGTPRRARSVTCAGAWAGWGGRGRDATVFVNVTEASPRSTSYLIFSDATLREMARERPVSPEAFLAIKGVGQRKLQELGPRFMACIREHA